MTPTPSDIFALARLVADMADGNELATVAASFRPIVAHLASLAPVDRQGALDAFLRAPGVPRDEIIRAMAGVDPTGPPPRIERPRSAHLGDLATSTASSRFVWPNWLVRGHFNLLSSDPKIGKTHLTLDLARRIWTGENWPDNQAATFPAGTTTLWVCGDRHQDELRERAGAFGLPDEAVRLNARPDNPYGGWDLDDPDNVALLRELIEGERPGLVVIDTVWRCTRRQLRREEEANALLDPIITIAQDTDTAVLGLMHLSKDGETLGRRLEGLARAVMKLTRPDPAGQPDRRRLGVIGNFKESPPLGVTLGDAGCDFDFHPPQEAAAGKSKGGRPPEKLDKAIRFLVERLSTGDRKMCELVNEWERSGESSGTLFNAGKAMEADGRLVADVSVRPKIWHLVPAGSETVNNPDPDHF